MVDLRVIGNNGLIIQYEDIVSLIGFNIASYLKSKGLHNEKLMRMSEKDILISYVNRSTYSPSEWLQETFDIKIDINDFIDSNAAFTPNNLYAYKMFLASSKENIKNLIVYSEQYSPIIEQNIQTFEISEVKYMYGDIAPILNNYPNSTFTTSNPNVISKLISVDKPFEIVIVDDFLYLSNIINDSDIVDRLRKEGKYVVFTSLSKAGTK